MDIPRSYKIQDGCHNCKYVFRRWEYDDQGCFFCTFLSPRPKCCCSTAMKEKVHDLPKEDQSDAYKIWFDWAEKHEVCASGICHHFEERTT